MTCLRIWGTPEIVIVFCIPNWIVRALRFHFWCWLSSGVVSLARIRFSVSVVGLGVACGLGVSLWPLGPLRLLSGLCLRPCLYRSVCVTVTNDRVRIAFGASVCLEHWYSVHILKPHSAFTLCACLCVANNSLTRSTLLRSDTCLRCRLLCVRLLMTVIKIHLYMYECNM